MAPLLKELSSLEVQPLEIVVDAPESEQDNNLDTLTVTLTDLEVATLLKGVLPISATSTSCCCCILCCCC